MLKLICQFYIKNRIISLYKFDIKRPAAHTRAAEDKVRGVEIEEKQKPHDKRTESHE